MKITDNKKFDTRHGSAFDRGAADSWYSRPVEPHYFTAGSYMSTKIEAVDMNESEIKDYLAGYDYNEQFGGKKDYS